jgi:NAD(P)H-dependent flavin oxidoreductase YrpB (nitropropane dioxygenase family)
VDYPPFAGAGLLSRSAGTRFAAWQGGDFSQEIRKMASDYKRGDHVEWNSEAGRVRGTIQKKVTSEITFKGYKRHASKEEPQYIIKSDKTDHLAIHKGSALKKIKKSSR